MDWLALVIWEFFVGSWTSSPSKDHARIRSAYRQAWRARHLHGGDDSDLLFAEMKRENVPGVYTEPYNEMISAALEAWSRGCRPQEFRRLLRERLRRAKKLAKQARRADRKGGRSARG